MELLITLWAGSVTGMVLGAMFAGLSFGRVVNTGLGIAGGAVLWVLLQAIGADSASLLTGAGDAALLMVRAVSGALAGAVALWVAAGVRAALSR